VTVSHAPSTAASTAVSIVTPTLNQARYLPATLASVQAQTYPVAEHIVVDGGSTDGTLEILERAAAASNIRWSSGPDTGMYEAVNKGLATARGDILAYLPSDDAYLPWTIEEIVKAFARRPDIDLLFGDGVSVRPDSGIQTLRLYPPFHRRSLLNHASLLQPAVFWRRRLFERIGGFDASLRYVADLDYWLRSAAAGASIAHVDEILAVERVHDERLSSAQSEVMRREELAMRARHGSAGPDSAAKRRAAARNLRWQRWLWLRFLVASSIRTVPGPWHRFLREGDVTVRRRRALGGLLPRRQKRWRGAMESRLAAKILGADGT
jgi:GT2 family glycosyltransferase